MYLNAALPAVQASNLQELPVKTQLRLIQQHPQQQQQQQQQQQRNQHHRHHQHQHHQQHNQQQQQHQQMEVYTQSRLERLSVERASDFAAHLASYLWFRDAQAQQQHHHYDFPRYAFNESRARGSFRKFCREVITATQVSNSVIALSLLYICRMKRQCSSIRGHPGSEFRAFTVALMLANKFLDDNTYTNKTWSEVTNIPVREINIMEMEFFSALDFTLYVSLHQYYEWVYWLDQFVDAANGNGHNDDGSVPDCSLTQQQSAGSHCPSPMQHGAFGQTTSQQQQQARIVPQLTVDTTPPAVGYKRSAEQAFDAMVTSPPKRTNSADGSHPVYPQKVITSGSSSHLPQSQQQQQQQQSLHLHHHQHAHHHHHQQQQPHYQPHQPQPRQARQQSVYQLAYIENAPALFGMASTPSVAYAASGSTAYAQPQYAFNMYSKRMSYITPPAAIPMTSLFPTTVV